MLEYYFKRTRVQSRVKTKAYTLDCLDYHYLACSIGLVVNSTSLMGSANKLCVQKVKTLNISILERYAIWGG